MDNLSDKQLRVLFEKLRLGKKLTPKEKKLQIPDFGIKYKRYFESLPKRVQEAEQLDGMLLLISHFAALRDSFQTVKDFVKNGALSYYQEAAAYFRNQAEPFIEGRKKEKEHNSFKAYKEWKVGKDDKIRAMVAEPGGRKQVINWMEDEGLTIGQTSAYKYLAKDFPKK